MGVDYSLDLKHEANFDTEDVDKFMAILDAMDENPALAESASDPSSRLAEMNAIEGVVVPMPGTTRIRFR